jgi:hypothetical protein
MRIVYLMLCFGIAFINISRAQIILQESSMMIKPGTVHNNIASLSGFVVPKADSNHAWNYATLTASGTINQTYISNIFFGFSSSNTAIADTTKREKITSSNTIKSNDLFDEDSAGIYLLGNYVKAQKFSLYNYFADTADHLYIPGQNDYFRINVIAFPSKAHSAYHVKTTKILKFAITVNTVGLKKDSGSKNTIFTVRDTVAGWGTLRIPAPNKYSIAYKVLLLRRKTMTIDSYYIKHQPANTIFLNALGITQGAKTVGFKEFFYRSGSQNPLMTIDFGTDSTYTKPVSVWYSTDSIKTGILSGLPDAFECNIYPNPVTDRTLHCHFTSPKGSGWVFSVMSLSGEMMLSQKIEESDNADHVLDLHGIKNSGIYFLDIKDEIGNVQAHRKIIILN